jgi:hypothetical protein
VHSSKIAWSVRSWDCRPWIALRESEHSRGIPGGRLPTTSNAFKSARSSAVKIELKDFNRNLEAFPVKINSQPVDLFITDPSVKILCNLGSA